MGKLLTITLAGAVGGAVLLLTGADGAASADPDPNEESIVNTTCTYPQVVAALNATDPGAAQQFATTPAAQSWLGSYLASPPDQRRQTLRQAQSAPQGQQYSATVIRVINTCNNF